MTIAGRTLAALAVVAALLGVAACTSSPSDDESTSTPTAAPATTATGTTGSPSGSTSGATATGRPTPSPTGTVPTSAVVTKAPVRLSSPVSFGRGVTARISQVRAVTAKANLPGEISGPAVAVTIRLTNDSSRTVAVEPVVNLYYGAARTPASTIDGSPSKPFAARLRAGSDATGTYTFTLGADDRSAVRIEFSYTPSAPVVLWQGSVS